MSKIKLVVVLLGVFILINGGFSKLYAEQIQVQNTETFSCDSQADCKAKCKALPGRHIWKEDKTGMTHGTCTKVGRSYREAVIGFLLGSLLFGGMLFYRRKSNQ